MPYTEASSLHIKQVSWLTDYRFIFPSHMNIHTMDLKILLPAYSDRIAKDLHLIPYYKRLILNNI